MSEKVNFNNKGVANVKSDNGETMLRTVNVFDVSNAGMARSGKGEWDDFELMGASNKREGEHLTDSMEDVDAAAFEKRVRNSHVGRKILALSSLKLNMA